MGNHHSTSHSAHRTRKNVHWKSAGRPAPPGKPDIIPILSDDEPNAITLRWAPAAHDGGAPLRGYQVECNRLGSSDWVRTAPPIVLRPELILTGLDPPHRYQFRVAAINAVGRSEYSEFSDVLTLNPDRPLQEPPHFIKHLEHVTTLENDKTEFRVSFAGLPPPTIAWFKDDYEIFSSRRTAISTTDSTSVLVFHQTLPSDEGEIKCTATNRAGHAVTKARLSLEAAPKLRYPRQYEDGLLYEINETVLLKTTIVGKPAPTVEWRHDGQPIIADDRVQITNTPKFSMLKIQAARRSDRGEYQIQAKNNIGEDTAAFLVTITAPPDPPRSVSVTRQVDKSVTLDWEPPEDDGGCRIGNYVIEYYRSGWNVWLKAMTSRKTNVTLFDLIEGSEYRFRVKAESPYGMSAPSVESAPVRIPGRSVDMEFLAVESRIINEALAKEDGEEVQVSPAPRRKRASAPAINETPTPTSAVKRRTLRQPPSQDSTSSEYMLVLYPENKKSVEKVEKRKSFQLDLEDALSPPPISLSAPELSSRYALPFKPLRNAVSSTELLHERAMARFYKAVAMKEEKKKNKEVMLTSKENNHIPKNHINDDFIMDKINEVRGKVITQISNPEVKTDSTTEIHKNEMENVGESPTLNKKWQSTSFDEDYTASTVSTDGDEYSEEDEGSLNGDIERGNDYGNEEETYNPRDKFTRPSSAKSVDNEEEYGKDEAKFSPVLEPKFVPRPILKKRETDKVVNSNNVIKSSQNNNEKSEKKEHMTILKKITRMPVQKPFTFPKILKKETTREQENKVPNTAPKIVQKVEKVNDGLNDEGKTIIDYYGSIVKEYGSQRRPNTPLYLNTEDLKKVAEDQQAANIDKLSNNNQNEKFNKTLIDKPVDKPTNKPVPKTRTERKSKNNSKKQLNKPTKSITKTTEKGKSENKVKLPSSVNPISNLPNTKLISNAHTKQALKPTVNAQFKQEISGNAQNIQETKVVLKTTERATIVIPIDYKKLEERAKVNVRTAIDYTVDICLLLLAFWVYLFKDERLAVPFLILIIYRQLQETIIISLPDWTNRYTPSWLKRKIS